MSRKSTDNRQENYNKYTSNSAPLLSKVVSTSTNEKEPVVRRKSIDRNQKKVSHEQRLSNEHEAAHQRKILHDQELSRVRSESP
ncbi:hypothetical protein ACO0QE_000236 [Hanseniaspora vineae]